MDTLLVPVDAISASGALESLIVAIATLQRANLDIHADNVREVSNALQDAMIAAGL